MRNHSASCCPTSIHVIEPVVASHPISAAYHWCYSGSKPLQCSGYHCILCVPLNLLISRDRSRQTEAATAVWCGVEPVVRGVAPVLRGLQRASTGGGWLALALHGHTPTGGAAALRIR